jgi:hypothetical protein
MEIRQRLEQSNASTLVSSGACGADLLAQEAAGGLKLHRRVVLPFELDEFRKRSVTDRPGDWGERFDRVMSELGPDDVKILHLLDDADDAYTRANIVILDEAVQTGRNNGETVVAMVVWDGESRGSSDNTAHFKEAAFERGLPVIEVPTV